MTGKFRTVLLATAAMAFTPSAWAQDEAGAGASANGNDIIVTAQRQEQRLQDVPISITVLSEEKLSNNNITNAKDIATYTPGLTTNNRFGFDNTTWTIRGFTQEQRTTSTVGTYFADVVALRGSGSTQGGDGAGPGYLFDLQNVQVLKGPQGTLFGRNSTGGAVILTPRKPTDAFEGYVEGSLGDYDLRRVQAVLNVPLADTFKVRLGIDRTKRDGYLKNAGHIGFGPFGDAGGSQDNWAARLSIVADLTPDIENYTVASFSKSESTGVVPKLTQCFRTNPYTGASTGAAGAAACAQIAREQALGFWSVSNSLPDQGSITKQWQVINTTTWQASDDLTVKNIASYGEFRGITRLDLFGLYVPFGVTAGQETSGAQVFNFSQTHEDSIYGYSNAQRSFVEELQFQGRGLEGQLNWQAGLYLEINDPIRPSGSLAAGNTPCADVATFNCVPAATADPISGLSSVGRVQRNISSTRFSGKAIYGQASYDLTDSLKLTGGLRYTWDSVKSRFALQEISVRTTGTTGTCTNLPTFGAAGSATNSAFPLSQRIDRCWQEHRVKTSAPTWLIDLDYKPTDDVLLYAKWSRGYRQGGVISFGGDRLQDYGAEKVDTYEVGAKTSWRGGMPGYFNVAAFYNDFRDQQLQIGLQCKLATTCVTQSTAVLNAGKSRLYGFEVEAGVTPFEGLRLELSYAYLNTKVQEIKDVIPLVAATGLPFDDIRPIPIGSQIPNAMPHKLTASANYTLPLPQSIGRITLGGTFVYQSRVRVTTDPFRLAAGSATVPVLPYEYASEYGVVPGSKLLNLNVAWQDVGGMPIDAAFFMTNVTNAKVYLHSNVQPTRGFISNLIGEPKMWGVRLKYRFGAE